MQPLLQTRTKRSAVAQRAPNRRCFSSALSALAISVLLAACGGAGGGGLTTPPPPPQLTVTISPASGSVLLGETLPFSATVSNSPNTSVSWSVNGLPGGSAQAGVISADGLYTAPAELPQGAEVQVTATSQADPTKSSTAGVSITSDISVSITPAISSIELGAPQSFHATLTSSGKPDPTIHWSLSGAACSGNCGTVDANGNYTAPAILPSNPNVTLTAASAADPSKQASTSLTITSHFTLQITAPSALQPDASSSIIATLTPVPGSAPSSVLSWTLSGTGCSGSACGILTVITTQAAGSGSIANTADYTAPVTAPQPNIILITVTPQADPSKQTQASITIQSGPSLTISPSTYTLATNHRVTLSVTENGTSGESLAWSVNGIGGGNSVLGQICVVASSPCQAVTSSSAQVDYLAPGAMPSPNPISVRVASTGNPALAASAQITVINHILVSVLPNNVTLPPLGVQGFTATVLGSTNQGVIWQIQGAACSILGACGSITPGGAFTAPSVPPSPNSIQILALSQDDSTQSGTAAVSISTDANILTVHPASVYAGAADGFTLSVSGSGFVASNPGPGSTLKISGTARVTTCTSANSCSAPVTSDRRRATRQRNRPNPKSGWHSIQRGVASGPRARHHGHGHLSDEFLSHLHRAIDQRRRAHHRGSGQLLRLLRPQCRRPRRLQHLHQRLQPRRKSRSSCAPAQRHHRCGHLPLLAIRLRYQHELRRFRPRRRRRHRQTARGPRHHPSHPSDSFHRLARRANPFHPERESRQDRRFRIAGNSMNRSTLQ